MQGCAEGLSAEAADRTVLGGRNHASIDFSKRPSRCWHIDRIRCSSGWRRNRGDAPRVPDRFLRPRRMASDRSRLPAGFWRARPGRVRSGPSYLSNAAARRAGSQPTFRVADLTNPNLKPWAKAVMKRENDKVLARGIGYTPRSSCMPAGVPAFLLFPVVEPLYVLQSPKQVTMVFSGDAQVRRIYLDVPHSAHPKPSWYGESVGHYEGDTLVVDTIGLNDKSYLDNYRTPHSEKLHVVERWKLVDEMTIQVVFTVDDPDTFSEPWTASYGFRRIERPMPYEEVCAENNQHLFDYHVPTADRPDF
jgi:hypothetical protein